MAVVNNRYSLVQARALGELTNWTGCVRGDFTAWVVERGISGVGGPWAKVMREATVTCEVKAGYGTETHLFDRSLATIAAAVEGRLFRSVAALRKATTQPVRERLEYSVTINLSSCRRQIPHGLTEG